AADAESGCLAERAPDLLRRGARADRLRECRDNLGGRTVEQGIQEVSRTLPPLALPCLVPVGQLFEGGAKEADQIDRLAPRLVLLAAAAARQTADQCGQHLGGVLPADPLQRLERLV